MTEPQHPTNEAGRSTIWIRYLEMRSSPGVDAGEPPLEDASMELVETPDLERYKLLYRRVGDPWRWVDRRSLNDEELGTLLQDPLYELWVLDVGGRQAGMAELDFRRLPDVELVYFGLGEEFIGHGLGRWLMSSVLERAWSGDCARLWLHTCALDHPQAFGFYQRTGFDCYRETTGPSPLPGAVFSW